MYVDQKEVREFVMLLLFSYDKYCGSCTVGLWKVQHSIERNRETLHVGQNLAFSGLFFSLIMKSLILSWWHHFTRLLKYFSLHVLHSVTIVLFHQRLLDVRLVWAEKIKGNNETLSVTHLEMDLDSWREEEPETIYEVAHLACQKLTKWCYRMASWLEVT